MPKSGQVYLTMVYADSAMLHRSSISSVLSAWVPSKLVTVAFSSMAVFGTHSAVSYWVAATQRLGTPPSSHGVINGRPSIPCNNIETGAQHMALQRNSASPVCIGAGQLFIEVILSLITFIGEP